jgi:hypothetical protein
MPSERRRETTISWRAFLARIAMHGQLDAPWGLALAPAGFGPFGGDLLVGNFGSGTVAAYRISNDLLAAVPVRVLHEASGTA